VAFRAPNLTVHHVRVTNVDLPTIDLYDRSRYVEGVPHEWFEALRRESPVHWHEEPLGPGFWAVTRYDDVVEVNREWQRFSSNRGGTLIDDLDPAALAQQQLMMLNMDPPLHTRYRLLINKGFTPRMVAKLEAAMATRSRAIVDSICEQGTCDFVTDVAAELPLQVIADILGVPQEDRHLVFDWSNRLVGAADPEYQAGEEHAMNAAMELYAYAHDLAARRRESPRDDIVSILLRAEVEDHTLSELELDMFFLLLSVAGNETTRNGIAHGMLALIEHPGERQRLIDDPSLIAPGVEEMLRWGTPVMHFRRTAACDTSIGGHPVAEGDKVVIWYISANRDDAVFADPYRFDVSRDPNPHVSFGGGGPHFCLGANLARMEMNIMFAELLRRLPDMELAGPVQRLQSNFINGIKHLPVSFTPARPSDQSR
jgi:cholest-4-en-3-one 26-monooxygenase